MSKNVMLKIKSFSLQYMNRVKQKLSDLSFQLWEGLTELL